MISKEAEYTYKHWEPMPVRKWQPTLGRNHGNHIARTKRNRNNNGGDNLVIICAVLAFLYIVFKVIA